MIIACSIILSLFIIPSTESTEQKLPKSIFYAVGLLTGFGNMIVGVLSPLLASVLRFENLSKEENVGTLGFLVLLETCLK